MPQASPTASDREVLGARFAVLPDQPLSKSSKTKQQLPKFSSFPIPYGDGNIPEYDRCGTYFYNIL